MPYEIYKVLHLTSLGFVLISTAAIAMMAFFDQLEKAPGKKKLFSIVHGIFLLLTLVSGFGLLARLGIHNMPVWVIVKIVIWGLFGVIPVFMKKKPAKSMGLWTLLGVLFACGAFLAIYKPV